MPEFETGFENVRSLVDQLVGATRDLVDTVLTGNGDDRINVQPPIDCVGICATTALLVAIELNKFVHEEIVKGGCVGKGLDVLGDWVCTQNALNRKRVWRKGA